MKPRRLRAGTAALAAALLLPGVTRAVSGTPPQPLFRQQRLGRVYTLSAGVRPIALARPLAQGWGTRFTVTGDVLIPDDGEWRQARVRVGAEFEPLPGLLVRGAVADHGGVHVGLA